MREARPRLLSGRLAAFYAAIFGCIGIWLPFWPVWLGTRGLSAADIGTVLAAGFWVRVLVNPLLARVADVRGERKRMMIVLAAVALLTNVTFAWAGPLWQFMALATLSGATFPSLIPLGESLTLRFVAVHSVDYGRVRLWGSLAFIATSVGAGRLLAAHPADLVLPMVVGMIAVTLAVCVALPAAPGRASPQLRPASVLALARHPRFLLLVLAGTCAQASHAVYYGFSAIGWRAAGHSETLIGVLWAEGVIAEVGLFWIARRLTGRIGPAALIAVSGLAGLVRWTVMAHTADLGVLLATQVLHGLTFAAAHLGAMTLLSREVPDDLSATAQSVYAASVAGLGLGTSMKVAGSLFDAHGARAYLLGSALSFAAVLFAFMLGRLRSAAVEEAPAASPPPGDAAGPG